MKRSDFVHDGCPVFMYLPNDFGFSESDPADVISVS